MKLELPLNYVAGNKRECFYLFLLFHVSSDLLVLIHSLNKMPFCLKCNSEVIFLLVNYKKNFEEEAVTKETLECNELCYCIRKLN